MGQQGDKEKGGKKPKVRGPRWALWETLLACHVVIAVRNKFAQDMTKDFLRDFRHGCTVHGGQEDRTFLHVAASGYVKVQTSDDTCEGVCEANLRNENTREPRLPGLFEASH
jgi:hypothetical protein